MRNERCVTKEDRRKLNGHGSVVLWFTGLPASGKSVLTKEVEWLLHRRGVRTFVLDGDNIRRSLNSDLGYSPEDRSENIRRAGEVAKLLIDAGIVVLAAFISPYRKDRERVRNILEDGEFIEIYVKCPVEVCEKRDPKGLYRRAKAGEIPDFTGVSAPYEEPLAPELVVETDKLSVEEGANKVIEFLEKKGVLEGV